MKRLLLRVSSLGVLLTLAAGAANAQQYQLPSSRPAVSPWLNLLRQGGSPAANYYDLVRPQFDYNSNIYQLQGQTQANRAAISGLENGQAGPYQTGHRTGFMTHTRYFMNSGSGAGSPAGVLGARAGVSGIGGGGAARAGVASQVGSPSLGGSGGPTPGGYQR